MARPKRFELLTPPTVALKGTHIGNVNADTVRT